MQQILIPTDFSENARRAARYACAVFGENATYTILNTYEVPHSGATMLLSISDILEKDSLQLLREEQANLEEEFVSLAGKISIKAQMGAPETVIKKLTDAGDYSLVVMGTKGATGLKGALVGSVAANTMENLKCPVISVPEDANVGFPRKIVFAVDDEVLNLGLFPKELAELAARFDAEIMVLNVVPEGEMAHVGNAKGASKEPISAFGKVKHSFHFVEGRDVTKGIENFIKDNKVDLLAMVSKRNDLFGKLFGLSVTKQMMLHTKVPVMAFH